MTTRTILIVGKETKCPFCGMIGHILEGNYEEWYNITHERYIDYVRENKIVDMEYGCWNCWKEDGE